MPRYYPILVPLDSLKCLVVGGGKVAERKVYNLLPFNARITVISPEVTPALLHLANGARINVLQRAYQQGDIDEADIVFVATDDKDLNREISEEARRRRLLVNVVDAPELCNFIVPAVVRRGAFQVAISTDGRCPALSKKIRQNLERMFDETYGDYVDLLGELRGLILEKIGNPEQKSQVLSKILNMDLPYLIKSRGKAAARQEALKVLEGEW
jgi:precorrin-2 dehydrogenase/sirohydrochlorin ferrochelatase